MSRIPLPAHTKPLDRFVRADDFIAGTSFEFARPLDEFVARSLDEVGDVVRAATGAAAAGAWVVGYLAYEAGAAFDDAFPRRATPHGLPYAQFVAFAERCAVAPLDATEHSSHDLVDLERVPAPTSYEHDVDEVRRRIELGDAYQVNLTSRFHARLIGDPFSLYASMARAQRGAYNVFLEFGDVGIVSASPELFLEWDGTTVTTKPMKGTVRRGRRLTDDAEAEAWLRASPKDRAENVMIVDLLRNDLSRVAELGSVQVPALFDLERYETIWQMTSTVQATTRPDVELVDLLAATFPCGSITGAPKASAMSIIDSLEPEPRGVYCGAIGILEPPRNDAAGLGPTARFSVAIRTAVMRRSTGHFIYGSGGGITWSSDAAAESAEVDAKARVLTERRPAFRLLETLRLTPSGAANLKLHLDRLEASAAWFGFAFDRAHTERRIDALTCGDIPTRLRVLLERDGSVEIETMPLARTPDGPVRLAIDPVRIRSDDTFSCHKTTNRAHYDAARSRHPDVDDVILVNEHGEVVETTVASLLYRIGDQWYVPPLTSGGLNGIGRHLLIDDGTAIERVLPLEELGTCNELAVVSSLRGMRRGVLI